MKSFAIIVSAIVSAVVIIAIVVAGPPSLERERRFDEQRVQSLTQLQYGVFSFYERNQRLPRDLNELTAA